VKLTNSAFNSALLFTTFLLTIFTSCQKDIVSSDNVPATSPHLISIYDYDTDYLHVDSFSYNTSGYLIRAQTWTYDGVGAIKISDNSDFIFSFSGNSTVPSSYTLSFMTTGPNNPIEKHALYYDIQNRIVKDSFLNGAINSTVVTSYRYDSNLIISDEFVKTSTGLVNSITDTVFMSASGNVTHFGFYNLSSNYGGQHLYTYSSNLNPCYDKTLAESLGPWLERVTDEDFISKNSYNTITTDDWFSPLMTSSFSWTTDTKGRVIKGQQDGKTYHQIFHYSN